MTYITPPPDLVQQWMSKFYGSPATPGELALLIAARSAKWGADQELEATLAEVSFLNSHALADRVRIARRPKPPSLKEQALSEVAAAVAGGKITPERGATIRLALEALPGD